MSVISHAGEDYGIPTVNIQDDASATTLDATKVPTGQTMNNVLNSNFVKFTYTELSAAVTVAANTPAVSLTSFDIGIPIAIFLENYNTAALNNLILYPIKWYSTFYLAAYNTTNGAITVPKDTKLWVAYL